jgi:hypothetical protein
MSIVSFSDSLTRQGLPLRLPEAFQIRVTLFLWLPDTLKEHLWPHVLYEFMLQEEGEKPRF